MVCFLVYKVPAFLVQPLDCGFTPLKIKSPQEKLAVKPIRQVDPSADESASSCPERAGFSRLKR